MSGKIQEIHSPWVKLDEASIIKLTSNLQPAVYPAKSMIVEQLQNNDCVYIVAAGRVTIFINSYDGQEKTLMIAEKGCLFGETSVIHGVPLYISAKAITQVQIFRIPSHIFKERVISDGELAWALLSLYARKLRMLSGQIEMLTFDRPINRVCKMLLFLAEAHGVNTSEGIKLGLKLTHQSIADLTGLSRVSVANVFAYLYEKEYLFKKDRHIYIKNIDALKAVAQQH